MNNLQILGLKKRALFPVTCPNKLGKVGRLFFSSNFLFAKRDVVGKIGEKSGLQNKQKVKNCENSVFRVIYVKKINKKKSSVGAIS